MGFEVIKMSRSCLLIAPIAPTSPCDNIDHVSFPLLCGERCTWERSHNHSIQRLLS